MKSTGLKPLRQEIEALYLLLWSKQSLGMQPNFPQYCQVYRLTTHCVVLAGFSMAGDEICL